MISPILNHRTNNKKVLVSISFEPGWNPDLTSWVFQISQDGILRQSIRWYKQGTNIPEEELDSVSLDEDTMTKLRMLIDEAELLKLSKIEHLSYIDDDAMVSVRIPSSGEYADVPMLSLQHEIKKGQRELTEIEKPRFAIVEAIWLLADKNARYSIQQHTKTIKWHNKSQ